RGTGCVSMVCGAGRHRSEAAMNAFGQRMPIPRLEGGLPLLGHAFEFRRDPVGLIQRGRDRYGEIFSFLLFGNTVNVLTGAAGNEAFFKASDQVLSAKE